MVEAISAGLVEGEQHTVVVAEEARLEETSKKEPPAKISSKDQLKKFLTHGGERALYRNVLEMIYGKNLVEQIFPQGWEGSLSPDRCREILERIGQRITIDDLEGFYAELKSGEIQSEILKDTLLPFLKMWWAGSVRDLPPYWFSHFVGLFQNPIKELDLKESKGEISYIDYGATLYSRYGDEVHRMIEDGDCKRPEFFYASRELLARLVAYVDPIAVKLGAVIPIFNHELGRAVYYTLEGRVHDDGLHAYLFVPLEKGDFPAQLIFRGTSCYASTGRDLDPQGIGKRVFQANKENLVDLVKKAKTERIEVIGHSLGAGDAQRGVALLVEPDQEFSFKEISLYAFCAPRLEIEKVDQWKADLQKLAEKNKHPIIHLNYAYHESDVVTWTGDSYLSGAEHDFVSSNYLTVRSNSGVMQTPAHHTTAFFKDGNFDSKTDGRTFELKKCVPRMKFEAEVEKLKVIQNAWAWWNGIKKHFVQVETEEEVKARIEKMKEHRVEILFLEKGGSQHSLLVYSGWATVRYTIQPFFYYIFEGIRRLSQSIIFSPQR